ncbi:MAG: hypothetical protein ABI608_11150 [Rhizomicrobium sp.]
MNRYILSAIFGAGLCVQPALADTRDDVMAGMQRCRALTDDRTWLECAYGAQQPMRAKLGLTPAPDYQQRLVPPAASTMAASPPMTAAPRQAAAPSHRKASFMQILTGSATPVAVSNLESVAYDANDAFFVTLQNGQIWHQVNAGVAPKARFKMGTKVTIKPAALGSYNLQADGHTYKVELKS